MQPSSGSNFYVVFTLSIHHDNNATCTKMTVFKKTTFQLKNMKIHPGFYNKI